MTYQEKIAWLGQYRASVRRERMLEGELEMMRGRGRAGDRLPERHAGGGQRPRPAAQGGGTHR